MRPRDCSTATSAVWPLATTGTTGVWPLAAGVWLLAAGAWPLAAGVWPLAAGVWPLAAAGAWPLAAGVWPLAAGAWPLAVGVWPLPAGAWLLAAGFQILYSCVVPIPKRFQIESAGSTPRRDAISWICSGERSCAFGMVYTSVFGAILGLRNTRLALANTLLVSCRFVEG